MKFERVQRKTTLTKKMKTKFIVLAHQIYLFVEIKNKFGKQNL